MHKTNAHQPVRLWTGYCALTNTWSECRRGRSIAKWLSKSSPESDQCLMKWEKDRVSDWMIRRSNRATYICWTLAHRSSGSVLSEHCSRSPGSVDYPCRRSGRRWTRSWPATGYGIACEDFDRHHQARRHRRSLLRFSLERSLNGLLIFGEGMLTVVENWSNLKEPKKSECSSSDEFERWIERRWFELIAAIVTTCSNDKAV